MAGLGQGTEAHDEAPVAGPVVPGTSVFSVGRGSDRVSVVAADKGEDLPPTLLADLRRRLPSAVENGELVLYYQPIVRIASGELAGVEALVRWNHPEYGLLGPGLFLSVAAEMRLLSSVTAWVARRAVHQHQAWAGEGRAVPHLAVNLTASDLTDDLVEEVRRLVVDAELSGGFLGLELSEQAVIPDEPAVAARLHTLRSFGVRVALDDFGTGFSSLAHLKDLPVDTLKIDRRFILGLERDADDRAIVAATIDLARRMGRRVIAEGIETPGQARFLHEAGCELGQGYLYSVPLPAPVMAARLRRREPLPIDLG